MNISHNSLKLTFAISSVLISSIVLVGCNSNMKETKTDHESEIMVSKKDGDIKVPSSYRSWPKFVSVIDKNKTAQVREIYINDTGMTAKKGDAFPSGTVSVMELWSAKKSASGALIKTSNEKLVKNKLTKVFVMEKGTGWGKMQTKETINNGDWLYGAYMADAKTPATKDFTSCRSCHEPLADKDFIARYDQHFDTYKK